MIQFLQNNCIKSFYILFLIREVYCDEVDRQQLVDDFIPEMYTMYIKSLDFDDGVVSFRRVLRNDRKYNIHVKKLKDVNGFKRHNLIVREEAAGNPIIYISNPVETRIPNAYLTQEEFKKELTERILRQREEFDKKKYDKTYATLKLTNTTPNKVLIFKSNTFKKRITPRPEFTTLQPTLAETSKVESTVEIVPNKNAVVNVKNLTQRTVMKFSQTENTEPVTKRLPNDLIKNERTIDNNKESAASYYLVKNTTAHLTEMNPSTERLTTKMTTLTSKMTTLTTQELDNVEFSTAKPETTIEKSTVNMTTELTTKESITDTSLAKKSTTEEVTTEELTTTEKSSDQLTKKIATTLEPTTEELTTLGPTTEELTTLGPTTEELTTLGPTTEELTTLGPTTEELTTLGPTTEELTTLGPTTEKIATVELTTGKLTTEELTIEQPTIEELTTEEPLTEELITEKLTTEKPTTEESITEMQTTEESITEMQTTEKPTTEELTTEVPTTETTTVKISIKSKRTTLARPMVFMGGNENNWNRWD